MSVSSSIFLAFSTFQDRASKYLLRHPSVQNFKLRPDRGPRAALSSFTCLQYKFRGYVILHSENTFIQVTLWIELKNWSWIYNFWALFFMEFLQVFTLASRSSEPFSWRLWDCLFRRNMLTESESKLNPNWSFRNLSQ